MNKPIQLFKVFMSDTASTEVSKVLNSGYIGQGSKVDDFEDVLKEWIGNDFVSTTNSATSAEHLALHLLKNTKCSIYGASGAVTLTFFTNTPVFTQQSKENGDRLNFNWQKSLSNSHKCVKLFNKYSMGELYNSPVQELFDEFKEFYEGLNDE